MKRKRAFKNSWEVTILDILNGAYAKLAILVFIAVNMGLAIAADSIIAYLIFLVIFTMTMVWYLTQLRSEGWKSDK